VTISAPLPQLTSTIAGLEAAMCIISAAGLRISGWQEVGAQDGNPRTWVSSCACLVRLSICSAYVRASRLIPASRNQDSYWQEYRPDASGNDTRDRN
jgi:hypothetical protein